VTGGGAVLHRLEWLGRVPGTSWFLGKTTLRWGLPYREFIVELFLDQHPWGSIGNRIWKREKFAVT